MSISVIRENQDGLIEWNETIASTSFFIKCWDPAISELKIQYFQENGFFDRTKLSIVLKELSAIEEWAVKNLNNHEAGRVEDTVMRLQKTIPEAFVGNEDATLFIY